MAKDIKAIFEQMVAQMHSLDDQGRLLEDCMSLSAEAIRHVPLRCRIIALGFVKRFTLEQLNEKLMQQGCPRLYARNFWEATLIFAFQRGYTFAQWQAVQARCAEIHAQTARPAWFAGGKITYGELERYVQAYSAMQGDVMATQMHTKALEAQLACADDVDGLHAFLRQHAHAFSTMREKTRYYFCKYLYYYLNRRIERYFDACRAGRGVDEALGDMLALKVVTTLRRSRAMPEAEKRARIRDSAISCGEIFDAFNYFYFDYVSADWVEVLMECYPCVEEIPKAQKKQLAAALRKGHADLRKASDDEVITRRMAEMEQAADERYALTGGQSSGKSRAGEIAIYKCIQGTLDIDRTVLLCFLLFFASDASMPEAHRLNEARVQEVLTRCGYTPLDMENDFDWFVAEFAQSERPQALLTGMMIEYAKQSENSFLYHIYGNTAHYEADILRAMVGGQ